MLAALALSTRLTAQRPSAFEISSIKRNLGTDLATDVRQLPDGTYSATNISIRNLLALGWPTENFEYQNLPDWAIRNRYDVAVKPPAGWSPAHIQDMWRALFRTRLRLEAHNEARDTPIYALVVDRADRRLGPQLKRSPHDCAALAAAAAAAPVQTQATPPSEDEVMNSCRLLFLGNRTISGGTLLSTFAGALSSSGVGRLVEDRTGLEGYFALTLTFAGPSRPGADVPADPGDAPSIFVALQEQLGLRLEPARKQVQTVVIDHIEPPTEN